MQPSAQSSKAFQIVIIVFLLLIVLNLSYLDWKMVQSKNMLSDSGQARMTEDVTNDIQASTKGCDEDCQKLVDEKIYKSIATLSAQPKTTQTKVVTVDKTEKTGTTYIPLNGSSSTYATDWTDIPTTDVYIKAEDYGKDPYISFEATLKTTHIGGKVYARLFDVTNGIAVNGSEVSVDSQDFTLVSTANLPFWAGNNLYRVQIKSLDGGQVFYSSGRIKIVAK